MDAIKKLIVATALTDDIEPTIRTDAQAQLERVKELVNKLCFDEQRMSSYGAESYQELRKEVGLDR